MSDAEATLVESQATPEVQQAAEAMGWIPPKRFKGDPDRFIDADTYIKRGEEVLPIVREQNKRLHSELDTLKRESQQTRAALDKATKTLEQLEEVHTVATQKAVEDARRQLKIQLSAASEAGDHDGVAELTDQLVKMNAAVPDKAPAEKVTPPAEFTPPPDLAQWNAENPWFGTNKRKTALALGIAQELRDAGETSQGRVFFDLVTAELDKELGTSQPRGDKVEGARGNGEAGGTGTGNKASYAAMPAEARAACDSDAKRFVGEGKKYKTIADWRTRYAEIYHGA